MFEIEAHNMVTYTCTISDEDEKRIKDYISNNPSKFEYLDDRDSIIKAIYDLEIELYNNCVESDSYTEEIVWSTFEDRSPEEILSR